MRCLPLLLLVAAAPAAAQDLRIYSEFQRVDPFGEVVQPDRGGAPREILSPMVARNAWASFHLACTVGEGVPSFLYVQQNPELFEVTVYKELFVETPQGWIPDALQKVTLPHTILLPDAVKPLPRQTTVVFWLDIWVPAGAPPGRMRFQALLKTGDRWLVAPMEMRVMQATVPGTHSSAGPLPPVTARADAALLGVLRKRVCGTAESGKRSRVLTVRNLLRRNGLQDVALAQAQKAAAATWCKQRPASAEWWFGPRYALYRGLPVRN